LLVSDHLQPTLDTRPAHLGRRPPKNELLRLDEKLDLADAAAPELDVVARHDNLLMAAHGVDLALHRVYVGDRRLVEILAPDERREVGKKAPAKVEVARRRTDFDERHMFPVLADRLVILIGADCRERDRRRGRIGRERKSASHSERSKRRRCGRGADFAPFPATVIVRASRPNRTLVGGFRELQ